MAFSAFTFARSATMHVLGSAAANQIDTIPDGFKNSIRWNAGHVLVIAESVLRHSEYYERVLPSYYKTLFNKGTSPADWTDKPPTVKEISEQSIRQLAAAQSLFASHENSPLTKVFELRGQTFTTVPDLFSFLSFHEGMHYSTANWLLKREGTEKGRF